VASKTLHVYRASDGKWAVKKAGSRQSTFSTQQEAVRTARKIAKRQREAQVVTHGRNGQFVVTDVRGLPVVQKPPKQSSLGTARISTAISDALLKRLEIA
jgi:hypothetical protein